MTFAQRRDETFLADFVLFPSIQEMNSQFRWVQAEHSNVHSHQKYDGWKLQREHLSPVLQLYMGLLNGEPISEFVDQQLLGVAHRFSEGGYTYKSADDPLCVLGRTRLSTLLRHPQFLLDGIALEVLKSLKDIKGCEPWGFESWANYNSKGDRGYYLIPGFRPEHVASFHSFVPCDELWSRRSSEMHRVFFASVGQALTLLSHEQGLLLETVLPRMDLMARNSTPGRENHHEPWCRASFRRSEIEQRNNLAEQHSWLQDAVGRITKEGMVLTPHCC